MTAAQRLAQKQSPTHSKLMQNIVLDQSGPKSMSALYPKYYKDVRQLNEVDVYQVHKLFNIQDPSGAIQHSSKKLLLSGVRTGGKSQYEDVREARDTLNRWLEMNQE